MEDRKELLVEEFRKNSLELSELESKISNAIYDLKKQYDAIELRNNDIKEQLKQAMEDNGIKKYENEFLAITYVAPTTRKTVDSKKLKELHQDIYEECSKVSDVKSSLRIKFKC